MFAKITYKKLFLIDSLGALVTAIMLGLVLPEFESFFGVPQKQLTILASIAVVYFIYSFACFLFVQKFWRYYLLVIAYLNLFYCVFTFAVLFFTRESLTIFGVGYFIGELMIVAFLAIKEIQLSKTNI